MRKFIDRYLIKGLSGMASGLFCTLIIGLIIKQIGLFFPDTVVGQTLIGIASLATVLTGVGIAIGTAHQLGATKLVLYASAINGLIGAYATAFLKHTLIQEGSVILAGPGDPVGAFLATVIGLEIGMLVAGKTKLDILVTPAVTIITGSITALILGPPISQAMTGLGSVIGYATELQPFFMGIVISVLMGMFLTLPISSAAIAIMLGLSGIAAGAATAGCTAQMVGFAVISYRENKVG
ncbi:MAG: PTS sugar transporter subunit IIC, partial [Niameybacter sp.]